MSEQPKDWHVVEEALAAPFDPSEIKWKPQATNGNRALAIAFADARVVQDRLDEVLGVVGWQDDYECLADGSVVCRLRIRIGEEWIAKVDVGGPSEQPDGGDRLKAAFSDALKRAAVKFGVGRYLYRLPHQWVDYDPQKRRFVSEPKLPAWALPPRRQGEAAAPPADLPAKVTGADGKLKLQQVDFLLGLIHASQTTLERFCGHYAVPCVDDLPPEKFEEARKFLQDKVRIQKDKEKAARQTAKAGK